MVTQVGSNRNPEKQTKVPEIPKSREIFTGDINHAVIAVQEITGFEITPEWWMNEVGNDGTTEDILDRFDSAFEKFVLAEMGIDSGEDDEATEVQFAPSEIVAEAESELAEFDDAVIAEPGLEPLRDDFIDVLRQHLEAKYFQVSEDSEIMEGDMTNFNLTTPESRRYTADEEYRFLVHVPLGDVKRRANEIGQPRDGVLMTSLITDHSQGTFKGYGGLILQQPEADKVRGISKTVVGGEIPNEHMDSVKRLTEPSDLTEFNQIDILFDGTVVEAVLIKLTPDGEELGSSVSNMALREFAKKRNLPVVEIVVLPMAPLVNAEVKVEELPYKADDMLCIKVPFSDAVVQCRVRRMGDGHNTYHEADANRLAGASKINRYGESDEVFTIDEERALVAALQDLKTKDPRIVDEDIQALQNGIERLRQERDDRG